VSWSRVVLWFCGVLEAGWEPESCGESGSGEESGSGKASWAGGDVGGAVSDSEPVSLEGVADVATSAFVR
jgi:hypothetical protein